MLKSTYRREEPPALQAPPQLPPLPPGWTEHKAPTGHTFYYNASTKNSTYTRPVTIPETPQIPSSGAGEFAGGFSSASFQPPDFISLDSEEPQRGGFRGGRGGSISRQGFNERRKEQADRPKHKYEIPGCAPWVLVKTKLGRRFVHNTKTGESFWKFPEDVIKGVIEFDRRERERRERRERGEPSEDEEDRAVVEANERNGATGVQAQAQGQEGASDSEYTEVEVTDSEAEEDVPDEEGRAKRQRTEEQPADEPVEFNEDDIAYQLEAMGQEYGLDPGEYGVGEDFEEGAEGLPLTVEDSKALFCDLLDDCQINPYHTWEQIVEDGRIIEDDRYVALPNMKSRRDCFAEWSRDKIRQLKEQRAKQEKQDPRIPYLAFLQDHARPKEYWPEFRKKWRREAIMKDSTLSDKDREKFYREHVKRLQLPQSTLKADLSAFLKSIPLSALNRSTSMSALPSALVSDLRCVQTLWRRNELSRWQN